MFWKKLKSLVVNAIKPNNQQQITGQILQDTLNSIISAVGENATFAGIATPDIVPGEPDGPTFYLAVEPGEYINFGDIALTKGLSIIQWNGQEWKMTNLETDILNSISNLDTLTQSLSYTLSNRAILDGDSFVYRLENKAITSDGVLVDWDDPTVSSNVYTFMIFNPDIYESITIIINARNVFFDKNHIPGVLIDVETGNKIIIPKTGPLNQNWFENYELTINSDQWSGYGQLYIVSDDFNYPQVYIKGHKEDGLIPMNAQVSKGLITKHLYTRPIIDKIPVVLQPYPYTNSDNLLESADASLVEGKTINLQTGLPEDNENYVYYEWQFSMQMRGEQRLNSLRVIPALDSITACIYYGDIDSPVFIAYQTLSNGVINLNNLILAGLNNYLIRLVMPRYISRGYKVFMYWADDSKSLTNKEGYSNFIYPTAVPVYIIPTGLNWTVRRNIFPGADGIMHSASGYSTAVYDISKWKSGSYYPLRISISRIQTISLNGNLIYGAIWFVDKSNKILMSIPLTKVGILEGFHVPNRVTRILVPVAGFNVIYHYQQCGRDIDELQQDCKELKEENQKLKMYIDDIIPNYVYATNTDTTSLDFTLGSYKGLEWSFDKRNWTLGSESLPTIAPGQTVYLRGKNHPEFSQALSIRFTQTSSKITLGGDIRTLIDYETLPSTIPDYCFYQWLQDNANNINIDFSRIKTIKSHGLEKAFMNSEFMHPRLGTVNLSNVESIEEYALSQAFYCARSGSSKIVVIMPSKLKTIPAYGLYQTFYFNRSRTELIDFSNVTEIGDFGMYRAFYECGLEWSIDLSNVTTVGKSGLKQAFVTGALRTMVKAPDLSKITSIGEEGMVGLYKGNMNLVQVVAPNISEWDTTKFKDWLSGTSAEGTIYKPSNLEIPEGVDGIPAGWTVKDLNTYYG